MIQEAKQSPAETVPHTINLKMILQSLLRFQDEASPKSLSTIDPTTIIYINYKKVIEMVQNNLSMIQSEVVSIDPGELKDTLFITRLSMNYVQYHLNLTDTRLEHLQDYLASQLSWQRHIPWSRTQDAFQRHQELLENQKKSKILLEHLNRAYIKLRYTIRQSALVIVKSKAARAERHYITDVETLEQSRAVLLELLYEIEDQLDHSQKSNKLLYYEPDRTRIFNKLHAVNLALNNFSLQWSKLHLDELPISPKLIKQLYFNEKKGLRWRFSDKYVFSVLCERQIELKNFIEAVNLILQPESHKLNLYANQIIPLGLLLKYSPTAAPLKAAPLKAAFPKTTTAPMTHQQTEPLAPLTPEPQKKPPARNEIPLQEALKKNQLAQQSKSEQPLDLEQKPGLEQASRVEQTEREESILTLDLEEIDLSKETDNDQ